MPRPADPALPTRIVEAADALWRAGGEAAVTIRSVAARASTTTPSVYAHFADRASILRAVRDRARGRFEAAMAAATGILDGCARYIAFAETRPRDYELLFGYGYRERTPADVLAAEFAGFEGHIRRAGVRERDVRPTALALASLQHGAAMFRLAQLRPGPWWEEHKKATLEACATLIGARQARAATARSRPK